MRFFTYKIQMITWFLKIFHAYWRNWRFILLFEKKTKEYTPYPILFDEFCSI